MGCKVWVNPDSIKVILQRRQNRGGNLMIHVAISKSKIVSVGEMIGIFKA